MTLWTVPRQASLSVGFSRQEYWSGLHDVFRGNFPTQGSNLRLLHPLHWQAGSLPLAPPEKPSVCKLWFTFSYSTCLKGTANNIGLNSLLNKCSFMNSEGGSDGKESSCNTGDEGSILGPEDALEKGMAVHSRIVAWRIPRTEEPGGLSSMELQRVRHN